MSWNFPSKPRPTLVVVILLTALATQLLAATPALIWSDEFNQTDNTGPDSAKWDYNTGNNSGWGNNELETYTSSRANSFVTSDSNATDGKALVIKAVKDSSGAYTSARILTQGKFSTTYGRIEARLKVTSGKGLWPAFWMLGANISTGVNWPNCGEIDIMEAINTPTIAYGTLHGPGYSGAQGLQGSKTLPGGATYNSQYHVFSIEWSPNLIVWAIDGTVYHTVTPAQAPGTWVFNNSPFFIILNLAVGGGWPGNPDGTTAFPAEYRIDYVRVYGLTPMAPTAGAASAPSASQVNLSWSAPLDFKGFPLSGYRIERATDINFTANLLQRDVSAVTAFSDTAVSGGTSYYYRVSALSTGGVSDPTATIAVATPSAYVAPVITTQPVSQTAIAGNAVTFTAAASGVPTPTYQWQKGGVAISGATSSSYAISNTASSDAGLYTVVATNSAGFTTSNGATLTINVVPVFTTQPLSLPAFVGATINFTTVATSSTAITYQWQKNGINIPSATSASLSLPNVQLTDAGSYAVVATDAVGSATSRFARLVVLVSQSNAIVYATTVSSTSVTAGGTVNLAYFMTNVGTQAWGAAHYLSIRDVNNTFVAFSPLIGTLPGETTTAVLNFPAPATPGTYTYYVQALENGVEFFSTQTTFTLTVLPPLTNSITYNTTTFPVSAAPGSNVVFTYNVTNTGTQAWGANHLLSLKDSNSVTLSSALLTVLAPGASKTVNLSFIAPTAPGTYSYTVQAAQTGVGDFNTHADLTLTVLAPRPNAIVYTRTRTPDEVVPGATLNLNYSLSNAGTQTWNSGHYVSLRDENSTFLSFIPLNGITQGGTTNAAFSFTAPTAPGLHTFYVQALENGIEFFSTQDVVVIQVDALPLRNAITYDATTFPATASPGATVSFTYNLTNRGTKTWGATDFLSFRDVDNTFLGFPSISGVAPGASKTVNISFTAPTTPGIYTYKAQGLEDGVAFYVMDDTLVLFVQ